MFSYISLEQRVPAEHPLRAIRQMVDQALGDLWVHFEALYARRGRPSIPPEQLCGGCCYRRCTRSAVSGS